MPELERLTFYDKIGRYDLICCLSCEHHTAEDCLNCKKMQKAIDKLGSHEATGLTPEQVAEIVAENEGLKYACEEMTYIIQKVAHRRCDYYILETEPCAARGLNAECCFEYRGVVKEGE